MAEIVQVVLDYNLEDPEITFSYLSSSSHFYHLFENCQCEKEF